MYLCLKQRSDLICNLLKPVWSSLPSCTSFEISFPSVFAAFLAGANFSALFCPRAHREKAHQSRSLHQRLVSLHLLSAFPTDPDARGPAFATHQTKIGRSLPMPRQKVLVCAICWWICVPGEISVFSSAGCSRLFQIRGTALDCSAEKCIAKDRFNALQLLQPNQCEPNWTKL